MYSPVMSPCPKRNLSLHPSPFLRCADLVLPYLPPTDLASAALTCTFLSHIAYSITSRRSSDASRGLEALPVPFLNAVDSHPYSYFLYSPSPLPHSLHLSQPWGGGGAVAAPTARPPSWSYGCKGCGEWGRCSSAAGCPCARLRRDTGGDVMTECGEGCDCSERCGNRVTRRGLAVKVAVVRDGRKGWGLHACQRVRRGQFLCEYSGEFLTTEEAQRRQRSYDNLSKRSGFSPAILVVREHLPSGRACLRFNIDATRIGNVARFINHSCDGGNLSSVLVRNAGSIFPRLCFFASRDIKKGEELTFSYGESRIRSDGPPCFCGSVKCHGTLPSEAT